MKGKDGQVLTEEAIEALAREAEAGYDPATLRPRRVGRPPLGGQPSRRVQFRVDAATYAILQERAQTERREISEIVRAALERYLSGEPAER
ncbi:MAG TPA: ribbon-helix-helix protein, CopG family [Thermomicrobiales bacterium]|nr:ribbon-helix-helix protein, CopG family [Thermomicrobiales bacterium]